MEIPFDTSIYDLPSWPLNDEYDHETIYELSRTVRAQPDYRYFEKWFEGSAADVGSRELTAAYLIYLHTKVDIKIEPLHY